MRVPDGHVRYACLTAPSEVIACLLLYRAIWPELVFPDSDLQFTQHRRLCLAFATL